MSRPVDWRPLPALAHILLYPSDDLAPRAAFCREFLSTHQEPLLLEMVETALYFLEERPRFELEELYTQTFDLNPVCTLEVGWHLYGEQYERGRFMVRARELLAKMGQDEGGELPDFLPSLLSTLPRLEPGEASDLAAFLLPAVGKMCDALGEKEKGQETANPYHALLMAVRQALTARVPDHAVESMEGRYRPHFRAPRQDRDLVQLGTMKRRGSGNRASDSGRQP